MLTAERRHEARTPHVATDALIEARAQELERAARDIQTQSAYHAKWLRDRARAVRQSKSVGA